MKFNFFVAILIVSTITAAGSAQALTVEGWEVLQFPNAKSPSGCSMGATFESGTRFDLIVTKKYIWAIGLMNPRWQLADKGTTDMAAYVDARFIAAGKASHVNKKSALLKLTGAATYKALQRGHVLDLQTPLGNLKFSLRGTANAMSEVLKCVKLLNRVNPQDSNPPRNSNFELVSAAEAATMLANLLHSANVRNYQLIPPDRKNNDARFVLADGTTGRLVAARGSGTVSADSYSGTVISSLSGICKGKFISGKETVPSTDGTVIRKVKSACRQGDGTALYESTIVRRPDGLLVELTQTYMEATNQLADSELSRDRAAVVDAAMRTSSGWK